MHFTYTSYVAQDIHFSIWEMSPLNINPAQTGAFNGDYRFNASHRNQWSAVTVPYLTFTFSADAKNLIKWQDLNIGLQLNQDKTGDSRFNTFQTNLSVSKKFYIFSDSSKFLSFGIQSGVTNKNLTYDPLAFDAQYNGFTYDPNLSNQESFQRNSRTYPNLNAGISYTAELDGDKSFTLGSALFNINRPKQSFYNDPSIKLDMRLVMNGQGEWNINEKWDALPSFIFSRQGTYTEVNIGGAGRYVITNFLKMYRAVWLGLYYRNKDALFTNVGFYYDQWKFGINYDINLSSLNRASNGRGGFEIAVQYIIDNTPFRRPKHTYCPDFL